MKHLFTITQEWFEYNNKRYCRNTDLEVNAYSWFNNDRVVNTFLSEELEKEYQKNKKKIKNIININLEPRLIYEIYIDIKHTSNVIYNRLVVLNNDKKEVPKDYYNSIKKQNNTLNGIKQNLYNLLCDKLNNGKIIQEHLIKQKLEEYEKTM